jgi:hypothetical protein
LHSRRTAAGKIVIAAGRMEADRRGGMNKIHFTISFYISRLKDEMWRATKIP